MKATLESTSKIVTLIVSELNRSVTREMQARIWEGKTESGIPFHAFIVRVAVDRNEDTTQFDVELRETRAPSPEISAYPMRMIL